MTTILLLVVAYFLPTVVAANRRHARQGAVLLLNALAGWTVVGWVAALIWALAGACGPREATAGLGVLRSLAVLVLVLGAMAGGAVLVYAGGLDGWLR